MSMKKISSNVEAIESEAQKITEEARSKADTILLEAREEVKRILSSQLPMDETKMECEKIISKAGAEADAKIEDSKKRASKISANADKKAEEIVELMVNIIMGKS